MSFDRRLTLIHEGTAARVLEGVVAAETYDDPIAMTCVAPSAPLRRHRDDGAEQESLLLFGEQFDVLLERDGFAFGRLARDGYVGWVRSDALAAPALSPTHRVTALRTYAFSRPDIKSPPVGLYSLNALVAVEEADGRFARAAHAGWFMTDHLAPVGSAFRTDPAEVATTFLGAPYLWGGRESLGLDCSGLVQQALLACGRACPRDTDMQAKIGQAIDRAALDRGDLVFWKGHVAMMLDAERMIHANAHHMAVTIEPLEAAVARIEAAGNGAPTAYRRP
ncbi:peptidoglycan endopeptidase [Caulobacter sp. SLTY]|uniref:C40 family peptidase n=1 Tax=Caulobacter sp. SLTY TaxID=2683262 RepID=UPI001412EE1C|nr:NlpC/P60 family protein [Caulobacter sp. SLTY]NBB16579.1 peptidoglycan endopeptidase [Caulobacter sp. SLTY]